MDIRQLESFLWIARLGSVTAACQRLNVTQSTLSMRLRALESDLRVSLFDRSHKRLTLTVKGRDLVAYAEKIVGAAQQARLYVADPSAEFGTIRIGVSELVALTWAPRLIRRVSKQFPNVLIDLEVAVPRILLEELDSGELDVVLAPILGRPDPSLTVIALGSVDFSWMASPVLGLPREPVTPAQLQDLPIISYDGRKSLFFPAVQQWFASQGATIKRLNVCNSLATSLSLVLDGMGIGVLPHSYCAPFIKEGRLQILRTDFPVKSHEYLAMCRASDDLGLPNVVARMARSAFVDHHAAIPAVRGRRKDKVKVA